MSIYGADAGAERSLDPSAGKLDLESVTRPGGQYGPNTISQEPNLPSDLWYSPCPPQPPPPPPPHPSVTSELPYMLTGEQLLPGNYNTDSYGVHHKLMGHNAEAAVFPQYIKQEPGVITDHALHPNIRLPSFIKQEPGLHENNIHPLNRPDLSHHNGSLHIQQDLGFCGESRHHPHLHPQHHQHGAGQYTGLSLPHTTMHGSGQYSHRMSYIKQEPGLTMNDMHVHARQEPGQNQGSPGPLLCVKQELGLLAHVKQEPGTAHSFPMHSFTDHSLTPFPSKPINFNFMADIEDIVQPTSSGFMNFLPTEISIDSLKRELAGYEGPYGCYGMNMDGGSREVEMVHIKREEEPIWEPPLWRQQYDNIRSMRSKRDAPVDKYGCFMNAEKDVTPEVRRYQVLVSLMLSSQTKDEVVSKAMTKLKENGLTINNVLETPQEEVARMIFPVGFWNKKAEYIKKSTKILQDKFSNDIPSSVEGLVSLPGIGPKMAHLIMDFAWGEVSGIAVDTHVHRITHRVGWMPREVRSPEEARKILERWFPKSEWSDLNLLFVGFGQQICTPVGPKCSECMNKDLCPSSSCGVSAGLPLGLGIEVSTKSKGKRGSKSTSAKSKKVKVES